MFAHRFDTELHTPLVLNAAGWLILWVGIWHLTSMDVFQFGVGVTIFGCIWALMLGIPEVGWLWTGAALAVAIASAALAVLVSPLLGLAVLVCALAAGAMRKRVHGLLVVMGAYSFMVLAGQVAGFLGFIPFLL